MNTSFTLKNVEFSVAGETIKIGELSTRVEDYNLIEGLQVAKKLPSIIREIQQVIVEGIQQSQESAFNVFERFEGTQSVHESESFDHEEIAKERDIHEADLKVTESSKPEGLRTTGTAMNGVSPY